MAVEIRKLTQGRGYLISSLCVRGCGTQSLNCWQSSAMYMTFWVAFLISNDCAQLAMSLTEHHSEEQDLLKEEVAIDARIFDDTVYVLGYPHAIAVELVVAQNLRSPHSYIEVLVDLLFALLNQSCHRVHVNININCYMSDYKPYEESEYYKHRCRELEAQIQRKDIRFNNILTHQGKHDAEVYQRENQELQIELERATKIIQQKRNEAELWKQKYETQLSSMISVKNNYEMELSQLSLEVQRLLDKIDHFEYEQRDQSSLKDLLRERDLLVDDLQQKLQRVSKINDEETQRLLKDNEVLRLKINNIELERQKDIESIRFKAETYHAQNIENIRKSHQSQIAMIETELDKLRGLLEIKNSEIETLLQQNLKQKQQHENQTAELKEQLDLQRQKVSKLDQGHRNEILSLTQRLQQDSEHQAQQIKTQYEQRVQLFEKEAKHLSGQLEQKNLENEQLKLQRLEEREQFEKQFQIYKDGVQLEQMKLLKSEQSKNLVVQSMEDEIQNLRSKNMDLERLYQQKIDHFESELKKTRELELSKNKDVDKQIQNFLQVKQALEEDLGNLRAENQLYKTEIDEFEKKFKQLTEDLKMKYEKIRLLEQSNDQLQYELKRAKDDSFGKQMNDKDQKGLHQEIEMLSNRLIQSERDKIRELEDLRRKLEESADFQIKNLTAAFTTQINVAEQENKDLAHLLRMKESIIQDLLSKYQQLEKAGSNIGPQEVASKNIYEMYLRTKNKQASGQKQQYSNQ